MTDIQELTVTDTGVDSWQEHTQEMMVTDTQELTVSDTQELTVTDTGVDSD